MQPSLPMRWYIDIFCDDFKSDEIDNASFLM